MNRDQTVITIRSSIENLVSQPAQRGSGLLWRLPSSELDLWQTLSNRSRNSLALGSADPNVWQVVGSGDGGPRAPRSAGTRLGAPSRFSVITVLCSAT